MDIDQLTRIFCEIDDFCNEFQQYVEHTFLPGEKNSRRGPSGYLHDSEIMTIVVAVQFSGYRTFKEERWIMKMIPNEKMLQVHHCKFDSLKENMQNMYKEKGKTWISHLPAIVDLLRDHWKLIHITPVDNMTYHFVAKAETESHPKVPVNHSFPHVSDWLSAIDNVSKDKLPKILLLKAIDLKNRLLSTMSNEKLLHGDLHHDNILQHGKDWIIIDPKGVIGDIEFEAAAFDFMYVSELANSNDAKEIIHPRIELLAKKSNLNQKRLMDWIYVRLILMAA